MDLTLRTTIIYFKHKIIWKLTTSFCTQLFGHPIIFGPQVFGLKYFLMYRIVDPNITNMGPYTYYD